MSCLCLLRDTRRHRDGVITLRSGFRDVVHWWMDKGIYYERRSHRMLARLFRSEECRTFPAQHRTSRVAPKCWTTWLLDVSRAAVVSTSPPSLCPLLVFREVVCSDGDSFCCRFQGSPSLSMSLSWDYFGVGMMSVLFVRAGSSPASSRCACSGLGASRGSTWLHCAVWCHGTGGFLCVLHLEFLVPRVVQLTLAAVVCCPHAGGRRCGSRRTVSPRMLFGRCRRARPLNSIAFLLSRVAM